MAKVYTSTIFSYLDDIKLGLEEEQHFVVITRIEGLWNISAGTEELFEGYSLFKGVQRLLGIHTTSKMLEATANQRALLTQARIVDVLMEQ